ncbi:MAG TPA: glycerate kinase [Lactobacillus sp.]|nr:glycerate kinase [Lactobacillus sp.]
MTKILIASDSYKGSATSRDIGEYVSAGIHDVDASVETVEVPIADGGEGTVTSLVVARHGEFRHTDVTGPLGTPVHATWGMLDNHEAILEVAESSGLGLAQANLDPRITTTYGLGQLIGAALDAGAETIYIGLGGSATNDAGAGMVQALGAQLLDEDGHEIGYGGGELDRVSRVDLTRLDARLQHTTIVGLSDVTNVLIGADGATAIYGPQKGATPELVTQLDQKLDHFQQVVQTAVAHDFSNDPGAGAAGGTGFGLRAFLGAELKAGIVTIIQLLRLDEKMNDCDLVITGEGRMDDQSLMGKAPVGIAKLAKQHGLPVVAIVGGANDELSKVYQAGIDLVLPIPNRPMTVAEAMANVSVLVREAGQSAYRAFRLRRTEN